MLLSDERHKELNIPWLTEIDLINVTYKNLFEAAGNNVDTIKERLIEYLSTIYETYGKDVVLCLLNILTMFVVCVLQILVIEILDMLLVSFSLVIL